MNTCLQHSHCCSAVQRRLKHAPQRVLTTPALSSRKQPSVHDDSKDKAQSAAALGGGTHTVQRFRRHSSSINPHKRYIPTTAVNSNDTPPALGAVGAAAAAADLDPRVYLDPTVNPTPYVGPIKAVHIPGKGRGLVATEPLRPGQLLLVTPPLALVEGDLGEIPEHDELHEVMTSSGAMYTRWQVDWLNALVSSVGNDGSSSSSTSSSSTVDVPDMMPPLQYSNWYGDELDTAAAAGQRVPFSSLGMSEERLWAAIVLNCYGEAFQDLPASLCSDAELSSQLGLWGPFALLNHSCCPNAVNYTLRDSMVVRAAAAVAVGEELCINYLGRGALRPLSQRQTELDACYGFKCNCCRCQMEMQLQGMPIASFSSLAPSAAASVSGAKDTGKAHGGTLGQLLDSIQADAIPDWEQQVAACLSQLHQHEQPEDGLNADCGTVSKEQQVMELVDCVLGMKADWQKVNSVFGFWSAGCSDLGSCQDNNNDTSSSTGQSNSTSQSSSNGQSNSSSQSSSKSPASEADVALALTWSEASAFDLLGLLQEATAAVASQQHVDLSRPCQTDNGAQHVATQQVVQLLNKEALAAMLRVCEVVCPGSDLHVFHALRWASFEQQGYGEGSPEGTAAFGRLVHALCARYGQQVAADEELLTKMVHASNRAAAMVFL